ncbi:MAG TPA: zinc-ribbon domain-containing protein [Chloroflexia bacterium]|nr:zinc-ribbon domain-containing protein [Chloroflexia bacterium]
MGQTQAQTTPAASGNDSATMIGWLLSIVMAVLVLAAVARPLLVTDRGTLRRKDTYRQNPDQTYLESLQESALAERQALRELEFDLELGSIEDKDYTELKQRSLLRLHRLETEIEGLQHKLGNNRQLADLKSGKSNSQVAVASEVPSQKEPVLAAEKPANGAASGRSARSKTGEFHVKAIIREKMKCGECGTPFKAGDRFCSQCSAPLPILCLHCGKEVTEDDRFCSGCGAAVNT